ncbi:uncharacterized protein LOC119102252 [Pollicipes pollicipes]|uniref:uncharacterized protein LOC119102252 n=1 Tax=Pollicipes pollicipes TaxID=41117 RepID=UPI00188597DA|nr:uncharacterized protein LOC119102252 [Pollicipes pollicipes]
MNMTSFSVGSSFTISCKNRALVLPTERTLSSGLSNSVTFTCAKENADAQAAMDDWPLLTGNPCIEPCPDGYTLYLGTYQFGGAQQGRTTCINSSPSSGVNGLVAAAKACGDADEQLADPQQKYIMNVQTYPDSGRVSYFSARMEKVKTVDAVNPGTNCLLARYDAEDQNPIDEASACNRDAEGNLANHRYFCMTNTGCPDGELFHKGFCIKMVADATASNHEEVCGEFRSSPAAYTPELGNTVARQLSGSYPDLQPMVGVYKRGGQFWRPGGVALNESDFEDGLGSARQRCAALSASNPALLTAVSCVESDIQRGVLCQTPGYVIEATPRCSLEYEQLVGAAADGAVPPAVQRVSSLYSSRIEPTMQGDQVTLTCPEGFSLHTPEGSHSMVYTCTGLKREWVPEVDLPEGVSEVAPALCVLACRLPDATQKPANSEMEQSGIRLTHTCNAQLLTADGKQVQEQVCDHTTSQWSPPSDQLKDCDHCTGSPVVPNAENTFTSNWETDLNSSKALNTTVTYACNGILTTANGSTEQWQSCTARGWVGDVAECSECQPWDDSDPLVVVSVSDAPGFGRTTNLSCVEGLRLASGSSSEMAVCTPDGWSTCEDNFNCTHCAGTPPNVTGQALVTSDWDGSSAELGTSVTFTCAAGLATATGDTVQHSICSASGGWGTDLLPCTYCAPRAPISTWGGTLTWDYNGTNTLDTVVTLTCNAGMATPDTLRTEQTTVCGVGGWNVTGLRACSVCTEEPPAPAASMKNISWTQGVDEVTYECLDAFQLPWNLTSRPPARTIGT